MEKEDFQVIEGDNEPDPVKRLGELRVKYTCGIDVKPQWCVYGYSSQALRRGEPPEIIDLIKPCKEDELVAREIASIINTLGGRARAEVTEFNKNSEGQEPVRVEKDEHGDDIIIGW